MSANGPGDVPAVVRRRAARQKHKRGGKPPSRPSNTEAMKGKAFGSRPAPPPKHPSTPRRPKPTTAEREATSIRNTQRQVNVARAQQHVQAVANAPEHAPTESAAAAENERSIRTGHSVAPRPTARPLRFFDPIFVPDKNAKRGYRPPRGYGVGPETSRKIQHAVERLYSTKNSLKEKDQAAEDLKGLGVIPSEHPDTRPMYTPGEKNPLNPRDRRGVERIEFGGKITKGHIRDGKFHTNDENLKKLLKGAKVPLKVAEFLRRDPYAVQTGGATIRSGPPRPITGIIDKSVSKGLTAAGGVVMEGLDRPAGATEAAIAKGLANVGVIRGPLADRIKAAKSPGEVLLHGRNENDVTGADLAEGVGLPRQVGLAADLVIDPVMWAGLGLAPESGGSSLALVAERIRKLAPELMHETKVAAAFEAHAEGKISEAEAVKRIRRALKPRVVSATQASRVREIVREGLDGRTTIKVQVPKRSLRSGGKKRLVTKEIHLPANATEVVQESLRHGEARRIAPKVRLNIMTPLGRRTRFGVNIPDAGLVSKLPVQLRPSAEAIDAAKRAARIRMIDERDKTLKEMDGRISHLQRKKAGAKKINALRAERKAIEDEYTMKIKAAEDAAAAEVKPRTVSDVVADVNQRRQAIHNARLTGQDFGRLISNKYAHAVEQAVSPVPKNADRARRLERVQMYLNTWADTKGTGLAHLAETIGPMDKQEQAAYLNLRRLYRRQGEHDVKQGVLRQTLDDYVGQRMWETGELTVGGGKRGMTTGFQQHRVVSAVADYADPVELANTLKRLSHGDLTDRAALDSAERLWRSGHVRTVSELVRARLLRGEKVMWEDLTPFEKKAVDHAARAGLLPDREVPLFRTPLTDADTEGQVLLAQGHEAERAYNLFNPEIPDDQRLPTLILSAVADHQRVREMEGNAAGAVKADLGTMRQRLEEEIAQHQAYPANELRDMRDKVTAPEFGASPPPKPLSAAETREANKARLQAIKNRPAPEAPVPEWARNSDGEHVGTLPDGSRYVIVPVSKSSYRVDHLKAGENYSALTRSLTTGTPSGGERYRSIAKAKAAAEEDAKQFTPEPEAIPKPPTHHPLEGGIGPEQQHMIDEQERALSDAITHVEGLASEVDKNGDLWVRNIHDHEAPPAEGIEPRPNEALPHADVFNYLSQLPDFRAPTGSGEMVKLDPREVGYKRARAAGMSTAWHARWQAFDKQYGRSAQEELTTVYHIPAADRAGTIDELFPVRDADGHITGYRIREDGAKARVWPVDEVDIEHGALVPDARQEYWINTETGEEYVRPRSVFESGLMLHNLDEDRLWPTHAVDGLKLDSIRSGELDAPADALYNDSLTKGFQKVMGQIRYSVTTPFPAYHIRNLISDLIKSLQADSGVMFHPLVNAKLTLGAYGHGLGLGIRVPGYDKMKVEDFLFISEMFGARSGHHMSEVAAVLKGGKFQPKDVGLLSKANLKLTHFGDSRENVVRYMTFMQRLRANGGDAADAAWYMTKHHFNYNDLSGVERKYIRNLFLFYTWYRKNIPLQLAELARRPGFFAGISHTYQDLEQGTTPFNIGPFEGAAPAQPFLPDYVKDKLMSASVNWNGSALNVGFGAPWSDLQYVSTEGWQDVWTMITPPALIGSELITRMDPLTHRTFKEREPGGATDAIAYVYKQLTGKDLPRDENGAATLPWRLSILLRQLPFFGRATAALADPSDVRDPGRLQRYGSETAPLTGLNIYVSPKPGSENYETARKKFLKGSVAMERRNLLENLSNFNETEHHKRGEGQLPYYQRRVSQQDKDIAEMLRERGISPQDLRDIQNSGTNPATGQKYYIPQARKRSRTGGTLGGGGSLGSLSSGRPLGG